MLITVCDDHVLRIYTSPDEVALDVEALDVETTLRAVFDDSGLRYAIEWISPNRLGRFTAENGAYTLVSDGTVDIKGLLEAIRGARFVEPRGREPEIRELERRLTSALSGPASPAAQPDR